MVDEIEVYGGCNDFIFDEADYTPIIASKHIRSQNIGLTFTDTSPVQDKIISYKSEMGSDFGAGTSDDLGRFATGLPYGFKDDEAQSLCADLEVDVESYNRKFVRSCFTVIGESYKSISADASPSRVLAIASVTDTNLLTLHFSDNVKPSNYSKKETLIDAEYVSVSWFGNYKNEQLFIAISYGGEVVLLYTTDRGDSFSMPITIDSSDTKDVTVLRNGNTKYIYWTSGTAAPYTVKGKILNPDDSVLVDTFTIASDAEEVFICSLMTPLAKGKIRFELSYNDASSLKTISSTDGVNFS